jgi:hypothetical protein
MGLGNGLLSVELPFFPFKSVDRVIYHDFRGAKTPAKALKCLHGLLDAGFGPTAVEVSYLFLGRRPGECARPIRRKLHGLLDAPA